MATTVAELTARISADTSGFTRGVQGAHQQIQSFGGRIAGAAGSVLDFGLKLGGSLFAVKSLADGALSLGSALLNPAASLEQNRIAFTTLLGSGEKAQAMLDNLRDFANKTPFEFPELVTASQHMLAFGFSAKDVRPMLTNIGDAMAAMGQSGESVDRVATIFGQMHAAGKVNAQDMLQLTSMGIPAWQMLADSMGKTVPEVQKLASQGLIPADKAIGTLSDSFKNKFGGAMEKQSHTLNGLLSTLSDLGNTLITNLGGPIISAIEPYISKLIDMLSSPAFTDFATMVGTTLAGALQGLGGLIQQILPYFTNLSGGIGKDVLPVFQQMASFFMTTLWPAIQQIAQIFITQVLPVLMQVQQVIVTQVLPAILQFIAPIITQLIPALLQLIATIAPVLIPVLSVLGFIVGNVLAPVFSFLITVIVTVIGWIVNIIGWLSHAGDAFSALGGFVQAAIALIRNVISTGFAFVRGIIDGAISFVTGLFIKLYNHNIYFKMLVDLIVGAFNRARDFILGVWSFITTWIGTQFNRIKQIAQEAWNRFVGVIQGALGRAKSAAEGLINGVLGPVKDLGSKLFEAGKKAIQMLIDGIKSMAGNVGKAAGDIAGQVGKFLGFHSPTEAGPGATADEWMPNLGKMLASGLLAQRRAVANAAGLMAGDVALAMGGAGGIRASLNMSGRGSAGTVGAVAASAVGNTYITNVYPQQAILDTAELARIQRRRELLLGMY